MTDGKLITSNAIYHKTTVLMDVERPSNFVKENLSGWSLTAVDLQHETPCLNPSLRTSGFLHELQIQL